MNEYNVGETVYVDAQNGEMVFTTEKPEGDGEGHELPSGDDELTLNKLMSE